MVKLKRPATAELPVRTSAIWTVYAVKANTIKDLDGNQVSQSLSK